MGPARLPSLLVQTIGSRCGASHLQASDINPSANQRKSLAKLRVQKQIPRTQVRQ